MSRLTWDDTGKHFYETGVKNCVLFVMDSNGSYKSGVPWDGITSIKENNSGAEEVACWADGDKYASLRTGEEFGATIEAYQCPTEFYECDGSVEVVHGLIATQQKRKKFGLTYITTVGNDVKGLSYGNKLHFIYGATASPTEREYNTINSSSEALQLSWEISTEPLYFSEGYRATAHFIVNLPDLFPNQIRFLFDTLYGTSDSDPYLPDPYELIQLATVPILMDSFTDVVVDSKGRAILMY